MNAREPTNQYLERGTVVFVDLDNFKVCMEEKSWSNYNPNPITRFLTDTIMQFVRKYRASVLWGMDKKRGTEEAILFFQYRKRFVRKLIEGLRKSVLELAKHYNAPTSLSAGLAEGPYPQIKRIKSHSKKEFKKDPTILLAYRALKKAKKSGGNSTVIY
jgi:GGDEF domain-containing protein